MRILLILILASALIVSCSQKENTNLNDLSIGSTSISGKKEYLTSPYVTAGNRVYIVGHQDGSFPDLGWHIKGEMGGIWNHPIKLMDGFDIKFYDAIDTLHLDKAKSFTNYPMASKFNYHWEKRNIEIERWQYIPDKKQGAVIQLIIKNLGGEQKLKLKFTGTSDLRPTWLGERTDMIDGKDQAIFDQKFQAWKVKDSLNPWHTVYGSDLEFEQESRTNSYPTKDNTSINSLEDTLFLFAGETHIVNYYVAGSYTSEKDAIDTYIALKEGVNSNFSSKLNRYNELANQSKLSIPDKDIEEAFEWLKYNCDWLVRKVPEIGTGITAGIPDYPWWFGVDSEYALKGYMAIGQTDAVYETIRLLDSLSEATNGNGRIVHEVSTNGAVFNKGNINETPQFASLIWEVYQWNGDKDFLITYFPTIKKGLKWLMTENDANNNLFPDGYGMMEIHGMDSEMIDVAAYTQRAFVDASKIAHELGENELSEEYSLTANKIKQKINSEFWSDEFNSYADFIGTDEQALHLIEDAIKRAETLNKPWAVEELKATKTAILKNPSAESRPFVLHHNWVVNTPMEMNIADKDKAEKALKTTEKFVNPFGVFVTGIDRDESAGSDDGSFKGTKVFSYTGAVMTLPTSVQAVAENNYGNPDKALNYIQRMTRTFSYAFPGSIYEVSPDYGMITQAWNIYGFAVPIVQQFFGIKPQAQNKKIIISPQMPEKWDNASIENVIVSDNSISVHYSKSNGTLKLTVDQKNPEWEVEIIMPKSKGKTTFKIIKSTIQPVTDNENIIVKTKSKSTELILKY
ncbi:alpha-L-rhamnosidase-related protein [Winogradskyella vincentii]|uniref:Glycogen debranching protein n=1 Tax=Winogradskyella vincentii TaxID=2877122 RepID=A0ABS7Y0Q2_9FLAO|nr:glycogen debranching protein [Winogradskyella vincentii]MCA0153511.1 glycogen debranching protein [Winogradskyella vincentii]